MKLIMPSRISRRLGERFFFKAERDASPKSASVRRPYPPGMHGKKRRRRGGSEFGVELAEKQKVRYLYGLSDSGLRASVREATRIAGRATTKTTALLGELERRLDNIVYRLGFVPSRRIARQVVSHGHILMNERRASIASRPVRPGDRIRVKESSLAQPMFDGLAIRLKKQQLPEWLSVDPERAEGTMVRLPLESDNLISQNLSKVLEFYSR
ncbi:MAG: 30S ribosomal protein S4 [bacterium]|nr:30S ribosomal protein S4 [bacterium]